MLITASNLIKKTISLYRENFKVLSPYLLMLFVTTGIMTALQSVTGNLGIVTLFYGYGLFTLIYLALLVASFVLTIWFSIALVRVIAKIYNKENLADPKTELHSGTHLIVPAFLVSLLVGLIIIFGTILLIIPGIFLGVLLSFSYYTVIIDNHKVIQSIKSSASLVKNRWWATFWRLLAPAVIFSILLIIVQGIINIPTTIIFNYLQTGTPLHIFLLTLFSLISTLIGVFFTPLTTIPTIILYEELKKTPCIKPNKKTKAEIPTELPKL